MKNFIIIIAFSTILTSCCNKLILNKQLNYYSDTNKIKYNQALQQTIATISDSLAFTNIRSGVDSFEFNLWTPLKGKHFGVISISYYNGTWLLGECNFKKHSAKRIKIDYNKLGFTDLLSDTTNGWTLQVPITNDSVIAKIVDTLKQFNILNIPTQNQIPSFNTKIIKGYRYIIEYAVKDNYKIVEYINPNLYDDVYNQRITELLKFLQSYVTDIIF